MHIMTTMVWLAGKKKSKKTKKGVDVDEARKKIL